MKTSFRPLLIALTLVQTMSGQTETFDIATFVRPAGWSRTESNGVLILQNSKRLPGRVETCQIYLFPSAASNANPVTNFRMEWDAKVARPLGIPARPSPQPETTPDGWTVLTDHADVLVQGVPTRTILVTTTGFGKFVSVVVTVSPNSYQGELEKFFRDLDFKANAGGRSSPDKPKSPDPRSGLAGGAALENYIYTPPQGWSRQESPDRISLVSPMYNNGERCQLTMLAMRPSSRSLADDAVSTFRELFRADPLTSYPSPPPKLATGRSPQGWEYFTIRKLVGGQEGEARTMGVTLLLAKLDSQVATVVGTSKDFLTSKCFGELADDAWPRFFYSLQFKNARPSKQEQAAIQQRLAGSWITATASVGLRYTFLANGRYQGAGATQYRSRTSATEVLQTTQAYFGDGSYAFDGNTIVLTGDDHQRSTKFFRLQQVSNDSGQTWADELCLLDPGSTGEVCYRKE